MSDFFEGAAAVLVTAIEGGFMLSRAAKSPEPMRIAGRQMRRLVEMAIVEVAAAG